MWKLDELPDADLDKVHRFLLQQEIGRLRESIGEGIDEAAARGEMTPESHCAVHPRAPRPAFLQMTVVIDTSVLLPMLAPGTFPRSPRPATSRGRSRRRSSSSGFSRHRDAN